VTLSVAGSAPSPANLERGLARVLSAYVIAGLLFMLLPGTFLGVWNLLSISAEHSASSLSPAWIQAHGHAQIFGWIGTFIIGIGYYSLSKMGTIPAFATRRALMSWTLWTAGVLLRWSGNITLWHWRILLPLSAALELSGFLIFFRTIRRHKSGAPRRRPDIWMLLIIASTVGFLLLLLLNAAFAVFLALRAAAPEIPHGLDQRFLVLATWGMPVPAVWGFNVRWLPAFMGLPRSGTRGPGIALLLTAFGVISALSGYFPIASVTLLAGAVVATVSLNIFSRAERPAVLQDVHRSFPVFIRFSYVWLVISALLTVWAVSADRHGGIWGASRHALTVGFLAGMIFAIAPRILPAFAGGRKLFSPAMMLVSGALLNLGCLLRVASQIPAYEGYLRFAWHILPCSAVIEMTAVTVFALNIVLTQVRAPQPVIDSTMYQISLTPKATEL
jgi:hypothetical protein